MSIAPYPITTAATESERLDFWADAAARLDWADPWHTVHSATPVDPLAVLTTEVGYAGSGWKSS
ncbi:hypothetical protein [Arthrobacter rhombi]|uniref:Acetyl-coenzyme A synthetase n=1 Tax=Arthrobacter rhombi TaxID=71253 RepID=A0A1R4GH70_9MICC|nr:hypothetical protein [Arthrobacter rhombi]SJM67571.1 hypothetical protein FM101_10575 [Arthrobacter rhombi]